MDLIIILLAGISGALATFYLNNLLQFGAVLASSLMAVLSGGFFFFFPAFLSEYLSSNIPLVIIGASFIGMATNRVIRRSWIIGVSGFLFSLIYLLTGSFFEGYGGSLGTTAAISLCSVYALETIVKRSA